MKEKSIRGMWDKTPTSSEWVIDSNQEKWSLLGNFARKKHANKWSWRMSFYNNENVTKETQFKREDSHQHLNNDSCLKSNEMLANSSFKYQIFQWCFFFFFNEITWSTQCFTCMAMAQSQNINRVFECCQLVVRLTKVLMKFVVSCSSPWRWDSGRGFQIFSRGSIC